MSYFLIIYEIGSIHTKFKRLEYLSSVCEIQNILLLFQCVSLENRQNFLHLWKIVLYLLWRVKNESIIHLPEI